MRLDDGREAKLWRAQKQEYEDCVFSAGLVEGIDPDTVYLQLEHESEERRITIFLRPDEMLAIAWVCIGTLWSEDLLEKNGKQRAKGRNDEASPE